MMGIRLEARQIERKIDRIFRGFRVYSTRKIGYATLMMARYARRYMKRRAPVASRALKDSIGLLWYTDPNKGTCAFIGPLTTSLWQGRNYAPAQEYGYTPHRIHSSYMYKPYKRGIIRVRKHTPFIAPTERYIRDNFLKIIDREFKRYEKMRNV